jgi:hypothetical protein
MNTTAEPSTATANPSWIVETAYEGDFGKGEIRKMKNGAREIEIHFTSGNTSKCDSIAVDLDAMGAKNLNEALFNAVHKYNQLHIFEKVILNGPQALVVIYRRKLAPEVGYASIVKKGTPSLRFALNRVDTGAMKATSIEKALRKTAWETGSVKLKT